MARLPLRFRSALGALLNALGVPGFVARSEYKARVREAIIRVTLGPLFTVVSVNGLDIYFDRLTGTIDGVGSSPISDCK